MIDNSKIHFNDRCFLLRVLEILHDKIFEYNFNKLINKTKVANKAKFKSNSNLEIK